jgi:hypothetical protein
LRHGIVLVFGIEHPRGFLSARVEGYIIETGHVVGRILAL